MVHSHRTQKSLNGDQDKRSQCARDEEGEEGEGKNENPSLEDEISGIFLIIFLSGGVFCENSHSN